MGKRKLSGSDRTNIQILRDTAGKSRGYLAGAIPCLETQYLCALELGIAPVDRAPRERIKALAEYFRVPEEVIYGEAPVTGEMLLHAASIRD